MKNAIYETATASKKSLAIFFLTILLIVISGIFTYKISWWNRQQADLLLSYTREKQGKAIWKQILQSKLPAWFLLSKPDKIASATEEIDELVAIGVSGSTDWIIKYKKDRNFVFTKDLIEKPIGAHKLEKNIVAVKILMGGEQLGRRRGYGWAKIGKSSNSGNKNKTRKPPKYIYVIFNDDSNNYATPLIIQMYLWPAVWFIVVILWLLILYVQHKIHKLEDENIKHENLLMAGRMSARLAHEIKNPLGAIRGMAQHLRGNKANNDDDISAYMLETIENETVRLEELTRNILDFSKPYSPSFLQSDIVPLVKDVADMFLISNDNINLQLEFCRDEIVLNCDINAIRQILLNLLKNAVQSDGTDKVSIIVNIIANKTLTISVIDNGQGLPREFKENIFTPFYSTKNHGYGLGLAISDKLAKMHNGKLEIINNKKGQSGARSILTINMEIQE